jgi:hypothetical protein
VTSAHPAGNPESPAPLAGLSISFDFDPVRQGRRWFLFLVGWVVALEAASLFFMRTGSLAGASIARVTLTLELFCLLYVGAKAVRYVAAPLMGLASVIHLFMVFSAMDELERPATLVGVAAVATYFFAPFLLIASSNAGAFFEDRYEKHVRRPGSRGAGHVMVLIILGLLLALVIADVAVTALRVLVMMRAKPTPGSNIALFAVPVAVRSVLTLGLIALTYIGVRWARYTIVTLLCAASVGGFVFLKMLDPTKLTLLTLSFAAGPALCFLVAFLLAASRNVDAFFDAKRRAPEA